MILCDLEDKIIMITIKYLGHACFQLVNEDKSILLDPFLSENPWKIAQPQDIVCDYVLVSHGHDDHIGDAISIALQNDATVIATHEIAALVEKQGCKTHHMHLGGSHQFDFGYVKVTPAFHGSGVPGGHAAGFIINFYGKVIYFAGDTSLFNDMQLIGLHKKIDFALLPIGDNFTMGPDDAVEAVKLILPKYVIPMHYNTWPIIKQDPVAFKEKVKQSCNIPVEILSPGEFLELK